MVVQHNISAMTANRYYSVNNSSLAKSLEKLASGYQINRAGDNAAGLAVSEKMRAQIGGLTQASKNAEEGISMVQTYEGALQETDSILQRMRTLAVQSANGSYQDEVDREAIQLEFNQLNDELNQIADTDYNGVVVLNGGKMADGTEQENGIFDYKGKALQAELDAKAAADAKEAAEKAITDAPKRDFSGDAEGVGNIVDDSAYTSTAAKKLWDALGIDQPTSDADSLNITFEADAEGNWVAKGVTKANAETGELEKVDLGDVDISTVVTATKTDNGGFTVSFDDGNGNSGTDIANAVFNTNDVKQYDVATINFTNAAGASRKPTNFGFDEVETGDTNLSLDNLKEGTASVDFSGFDTKIDSDDKMDTVVKQVLDALNSAVMKASYKKDGVGDATEVTLKFTEDDQHDAAGKNYKITESSGIEIYDTDGTTKLGTVSFTRDGTNKNEYAVKFKAESAGSTKTNLADGTNEVSLGTITFAKLDQGMANDGVLTTGLNIDNYDYAKGAKVSATSLATPENMKASVADLEKTDEAADPADPVDPAKATVSKSNAFTQATRNLTYAKDITLQVGARTKDAVNFTFEYNTNAMGKLEPNMNCSAREGGLNTEGLSLKTAKEANDAIDKIDDAINKVSMVRATFGAIQNRLEHKINNIDTNTENMTAAESRIRDTQMDKEMMKFTSSQILSQASQSMLAQANQLPQGVLQLLG